MKESIVTKTKMETMFVIGALMGLHCWFEVEPLPDEWTRIITKPEGHFAKLGFRDHEIAVEVE